MTSQQHADTLLSLWQLQRAAGIKPADRRLPSSPANDRDSFECDLETIRKFMERA